MWGEGGNLEKKNFSIQFNSRKREINAATIFMTILQPPPLPPLSYPNELDNLYRYFSSILILTLKLNFYLLSIIFLQKVKASSLNLDLVLKQDLKFPKS